MKFNLLTTTYNKKSNIKVIIFYLILFSFIIFAIITTYIKFKNYKLLKKEYEEISLLTNKFSKYEQLSKKNKDIYLNSREINFNWVIILSEILEKIPKQIKLEKILLNNNSIFLEIKSEKKEDIFLLIDNLKENNEIKEILFNSKGRDKIEIKF